MSSLAFPSRCLFCSQATRQGRALCPICRYPKHYRPRPEPLSGGKSRKWDR